MGRNPMFFRPFRTAAIGLVAIGAALSPGGAARAQTGIATPPEVTVDLSVLDSVSPPHHRPVVLRQPREHHETAMKKPAPAKKAAAKPAHPVKKAEAKRPSHVEARNEERRAEAAEKQWEADRRRDETKRKAAATERKPDLARIKEQEAERIRQAKAEIEAAARTAQGESNDGKPAPSARASSKIAEPGPGPATPPPPKMTIESTPVTPKKPPQVAAVAPPPAPPPAPVKQAAIAPKQPPAERVEHIASGAPHVDFAAGTADLTPGARTELDALAKRLVADENMRVQLVAYATGGADEANQARRLSLSRALNVRAYLIDHGVRNTRMDVRALGNRAEGSKPADRVVILLQGK